jgi:hypothetical protein
MGLPIKRNPGSIIYLYLYEPFANFFFVVLQELLDKLIDQIHCRRNGILASSVEITDISAPRNSMSFSSSDEADFS